MKIMPYIMATTFALAASFGTASADDVRFTALGGIIATPMALGEMAVVVGQASLITGKLSPNGTHVVTAPDAALKGAATAFGQVASGPAFLPTSKNLSFLP